jgi:pimeloyl-ACP methyl ester carboxylesterase
MSAGRDRTIVLIPGLTCDDRFWAEQRPTLARMGEVVIPRLHDERSIGTMAAVTLAAADGPLDVIGHSMGGRVALEVMRRAPERVHSLAVLDTGVHPADAGEPERRQGRIEIAEAGGMDALAADWVPAMLHPDRRGDAGLIGAISAMVASFTVGQYRGQIRALLERPDARPLLASISCPVLVACGEADEWSPLAQHEQIAAAIPGARLAVVENAGHMVAMEQPEATTRLLVEWVDESARARQR